MSPMAHPWVRDYQPIPDLMDCHVEFEQTYINKEIALLSMEIKLTMERVMDVIKLAKLENLLGSFCVPQVDERIREIVANVDADGREPTKAELLEIIERMGYKSKMG